MGKQSCSVIQVWLEGWHPVAQEPSPYMRKWPLRLNSELSRRSTHITLHSGTLINCRLVVGGGGRGKNNRCQSSLHPICHRSKFQIIPQLRRKMKARMFSSSDILINYFLHMKNWSTTLCHLGTPMCILHYKISQENESFSKLRGHLNILKNSGNDTYRLHVDVHSITN